MAAISSDVATGRWMKGSEIFMLTTPLRRSLFSVSATV
jgi:hypothetical protein